MCFSGQVILCGEVTWQEVLLRPQHCVLPLSPPLYGHCILLPALSALGQCRCPGSGLRRSAKHFPPSLNFLFFPKMLAQAKDSQSGGGMYPVGRAWKLTPRAYWVSTLCWGKEQKDRWVSVACGQRGAHSWDWLWGSQIGRTPPLKLLPQPLGPWLRTFAPSLTHKPNALGAQAVPLPLFLLFQENP